MAKLTPLQAQQNLQITPAVDFYDFRDFRGRIPQVDASTKKLNTDTFVSEFEELLQIQTNAAYMGFAAEQDFFLGNEQFDAARYERDSSAAIAAGLPATIDRKPYTSWTFQTFNNNADEELSQFLADAGEFASPELEDELRKIVNAHRAKLQLRAGDAFDRAQLNNSERARTSAIAGGNPMRAALITDGLGNSGLIDANVRETQMIEAAVAFDTERYYTFIDGSYQSIGEDYAVKNEEIMLHNAEVERTGEGEILPFENMYDKREDIKAKMTEMANAVIDDDFSNVGLFDAAGNIDKDLAVELGIDPNDPNLVVIDELLKKGLTGQGRIDVVAQRIQYWDDLLSTKEAGDIQDSKINITPYESLAREFSGRVRQREVLSGDKAAAREVYDTVLEEVRLGNIRMVDARYTLDLLRSDVLGAGEEQDAQSRINSEVEMDNLFARFLAGQVTNEVFIQNASKMTVKNGVGNDVPVHPSTFTKYHDVISAYTKNDTIQNILANYNKGSDADPTRAAGILVNEMSRWLNGETITDVVSLEANLNRQLAADTITNRNLNGGLFSSGMDYATYAGGEMFKTGQFTQEAVYKRFYQEDQSFDRAPNNLLEDHGMLVQSMVEVMPRAMADDIVTGLAVYADTKFNMIQSNGLVKTFVPASAGTAMDYHDPGTGLVHDVVGLAYGYVNTRGMGNDGSLDDKNKLIEYDGEFAFYMTQGSFGRSEMKLLKVIRDKNGDITEYATVEDQGRLRLPSSFYDMNNEYNKDGDRVLPYFDPDREDEMIMLKFQSFEADNPMTDSQIYDELQAGTMTSTLDDYTEKFFEATELLAEGQKAGVKLQAELLEEHPEFRGVLAPGASTTPSYLNFAAAGGPKPPVLNRTAIDPANIDEVLRFNNVPADAMAYRTSQTAKDLIYEKIDSKMITSRQEVRDIVSKFTNLGGEWQAQLLEEIFGWAGDRLAERQRTGL